jgi:Protein of unknown function (DUF2934)
MAKPISRKKTAERPALARTEQAAPNSSPPESLSLRDDAIEKLAYQLWLERGCPAGSPEEDWFRAEQVLVERSELGESRPSPSRRRDKPMTAGAGTGN